jgi:hypothetical protein
MSRFISRPKVQKAITLAAIVLFLASGRSLAQLSPDNTSAPVPPPSAFSPNELRNLVAPVALYPDALLGQVLVACTYPLEVVEAQQWLQQNVRLPSRELLAAAQQQNWDPSVQALVAFPDVLTLLNQNVRWTTDLGNAFLVQQADVMTAIQDLRAEARGSGQLVSTPQLSVNLEAQGDQRAIEIQPANPQAVYVPFYNPSVVWGPPAAGLYPSLPYSGSGFGSLFSTVANLAGFLPGFQGLLGLKSWGWAISWLAQALFVNNSFFNDFGFQNSNSGYGGSSLGTGSSLWVHNSHHRLGVPYRGGFVARSYGGARERETAGGKGNGPGSGWRSFGSTARGFSAPEPRQPVVPRPSPGSQSFQRDERTPYRTVNPPTARTFSAPPRTTARDPYLANAANSRARSLPSERSFASSRPSVPSHDSFSNTGSGQSSKQSSKQSPKQSPKQSAKQSPEPSRAAKSGSWAHLPQFSKTHMSSHESSRAASSPHAFKPKHFSEPKFKAPHFKAPHASKSPGGGHSFFGHSGLKLHRG